MSSDVFIFDELDLQILLDSEHFLIPVSCFDDVRHRYECATGSFENGAFHEKLAPESVYL